MHCIYMSPPANPSIRELGQPCGLQLSRWLMWPKWLPMHSRALMRQRVTGAEAGTHCSLCLFEP